LTRLSTHILDTSLGRPAAGVVVSFEHASADGTWIEKGRGTTDADGRIQELLPAGAALPAGEYRLRFATGAYFTSLGRPVFYPEVIVNVRLDGSAGRYHLPLLLNPFGYSTYRGS
jgi:5-hydroxyisourate hydrolase